MMKRYLKSTFVLACLVAVSFTGNAQQLHLTNLYQQNKFIINPANAGDHEYAVAHLLHRQQWTGISGAPVSSMFTVHSPIGEKNAVGGFVSTDRAGLLERFSASGTYVYQAKINDDHRLFFGLGLGFYQNRINYSNIRIHDASDDLVLNGGAVTGTVFNADFGLRYTFKGLEVGFSTPQLAETKINYNLVNDKEGQLDLVRHYTGNVSYDFAVNDDFTVSPIMMARLAPGSDVSFDALATVDWKNKVWLGGGYRNQAGILAFLGATISNQLSLAYSYEFSSKGVASYSGGSHEMMIGYHFNKGNDVDKKLKELEEKMDLRFEEQQILVDSLGKLIDKHTIELNELKQNSESSKKKIQKLEEKVEGLKEQLKNVSATPPVSEALDESIANKFGLSDDERNALKRHIKFDLNGGYAIDESKPDLKLIAKILKKHPSLVLSISGHTCDRGGLETNMKLSQERADKVALYFYDKGVKKSQVKTEGFGPNQPIAANDNEENRVLNRRVVFEIIEE